MDNTMLKNSILGGDLRAVANRGETSAQVELWMPDGQKLLRQKAYDSVEETDDGLLCRASFADEQAGRIQVTDCYRLEGADICLSRRLTVEHPGTAQGLRLWWSAPLRPAFAEMRYFAPPALYDKNDLDEDGLEDYFHTQRLVYREERIKYPKFMAFYGGSTVSLLRDPLPAYDTEPPRPVDASTHEKAADYLQKTDIGGMGVWTENGKTSLCACYPYYEGDATIGLYISKIVPFGAYYPMEKGAALAVSYRLRFGQAESYHDAMWDYICDTLHQAKPQAQPLPTTPEELVRYRLEALNRYYVEPSAEEDPNRPAGYVLNCHPQKGAQLENIIQYGFTGQNILNAYNVMRYGYQYDNAEYRRRAARIADFFTEHIHLPKTGMFYNLYNVDMKRVNYWWTGLLLPLAYAQGEELEQLMGPLYAYRKPVIDKLASLEGAYLRCMNEDATALLRLYRLTKSHGEAHESWLETVKRYGEFLLRTQETDGGWYRAYDISGQPILEPKLWFGTAVCEQKSSTGTSLPLLVELYQETGDERFLAAAERGGAFVTKHIIDPVRFCGGVHDSIYAKGQLIDNESILYPMFGMLSLYLATQKPEYLRAAHLAARYTASWVCLWDVPLPEGSTLQKQGFSSIGMGACDTCGAGYIHPFQLMGVAEMAQIGLLTDDWELLEIAALYWQGCSQAVQLPHRDSGYAAPGLQEEGYLVSWWAVDDPMFASDTGFGNRLKGEGNKTCFPWVNAVGVKAYWSLMDSFGTCDFNEIRRRMTDEGEGATR